MAIKKKQGRKGKKEIDLTGSEGNAFVLLGYGKGYAKELGLDYKAIQKEMTSGDYENLISVFEKYFGDYVDLVK